MNKILLGFAAFTLLFSSCQENEIIEHIDDGSNQLTFGVHQGKATKAAELTNSAISQVGTTFPLYAYKGKQSGIKTAYFEDNLTRAADKWDTDIPRFLTAKDPLQFYAYYPIAGVANYDYTLAADAYPTFDYTIAKNGTGAGVENPNGTDLDLVAAKVIDHSGTSVLIPFQHILSQINFGVKGYYGAKIAIRNIKINSVFKEGTFTYDAKRGNWTAQKTRESYDYTCPEFTTPGTLKNAESSYTYIFGDGGNWGPGRKATTWYVTADNTTIQGTSIVVPPDANPTPTLSNSLMLMPQVLTTGMTDAYVTFEYRIRDIDTQNPAWVVGSGTTWATGQFDLKMNDKEPYADEWKPNLRYVYVIDFTGYLDGQKLKFDVNVDTQPWENYNPDGDNDGVVLLSSTGEPLFKLVTDAITAPGSSYTITPGGNVFSNIEWDWSPYTMNKGVFTSKDQIFTVDFTNVKFNGNTITITPPKGFKVNATSIGTPGSLTFTTLDTPGMPATAGAVKDQTFNVLEGVLYQNITWVLVAPTTALQTGESFKVDASKVWLNGHTLTVTPPTDYTLAGVYPIYTITHK